MKMPTIVEEFVENIIEEMEELADKPSEIRNAFIGSSAALSESVSSQLPGRENGPADAYRHILWFAEMTRRFGPWFAKRIAEQRERRDEKTNPDASAMDRWNNEIGVRIGQNAKTWDDVVQATRRVIERSPGDGTNRNDVSRSGAKWLAEPKWSKNPIIIEEFTGEKIEAPTIHPRVNWITGPDKKLDWDGKRVPEPFIYRYGGENSRAPSALRELGDATEARPPQDAEARRPAEEQGANARPAATTDLLVPPKALSLENKERLRDRLGFHAEEAERDPRKREKVAKCMRDCFVEETGFAGLPGKLPDQLGGIAATMSPVAALGILGDAVPEAKPQEVPRRRRLAADGTPVRPRRVEPEALDDAGRAAVRQAILRIGPGRVQSQVAKGAAKKAIQRVQSRDMMARNLPGVFGAAFGPVTGGADKSMRAAAKAANGINQRAGAPERADPADASGRESATAIDRAVQAAGADRFSQAFEEKLDEDGLGGGHPSRAGQSLLEDV